ncbi:hypothetical protein ABPG72_016686 [Tetrahymena utriculariae]
MAETGKIDENLYSRMMGAYGVEAVGKLVKLKIFLSGLRGVGIETAKNLILSGPSAVCLHDDSLAEVANMGCNFYLKPEHIGKVTRAEASLGQLKELNPYCKVSVHTGQITKELLADFDVVVITDNYNQDEIVDINAYCRANKKGFIYSGILGLYGLCFVDFGDSHSVFDTNGEEPRNSIVVGVTQDAEGLVTVHEDKRHGFQSGDFVTFREIQGMSELNDKVFKIEEKSPFTFTLVGVDTTKFQPYLREGIVEQVKVPVQIAFKSLGESLSKPYAPGKNELDICDWEKFGRPEQLHLAFTGLLTFVKQNGRLPALQSQEDAEKLLHIVKDINTQRKNIDEEGVLKVEEIEEQIVKNIALYARAQITPLSSFWGGIVAQEIVKFTGKFTPLRQWLHYECFEALPEGEVNRTLLNSQYDDQIAIFGREFQQKLLEQRTFLVGAGALGCEYIKMFALMGLGSEKNGGVVVTDDDQIEMSNLNRQFLFRKENIGHSKSECATRAGKIMNPKLHIEALKERVDPENERIFNDSFWEGLDFVVNAVDNVKARLFVDGRCVWYGKPLFESGTLGTKCNSQIVLPKLTQSYGDSVDPPEESIPLCTLKNFPYQIEHTIQWARDYFEGNLVEGPNETSKYVENPQAYINQVTKELRSKPVMLRGRLEIVKKLATAYSGNHYDKCIELARHMFQDIFYNQISQLLYSFPLDHKTESGQPFWSGPKRPPIPIKFDTNDDIHVDFIQSAANVFAFIFGLPYCHDREYVKKAANSVHVEEFVPKKASIKVDDKDKTEEKVEDDEIVTENLTKELLNFNLNQHGQNNPKLNPIEFEKDDPTNWHIDFISSVANLRARNYKIKEVTKFKVKMIAGKIIPALATTTAMVVGAVGIEIFKYILNKPLNKMKNSFMNLALPLWIFSEPEPPIKAKDKDYDPVLMGPVKAIPAGFTTWDKLFVQGPLTIQGIKDYFNEKYQVNISILSVGKICLYNSYMAEAAERESWDIAQGVEKLGGQPIPDFKKFLELEICAETPTGEDALMPTIKYAFKA